MELAPNGNFVVKKANGKSKDFGTDERIWSEGFLTYVQIIGYLFPEHFATSLAMLRFHSRVVELSRVYQWSAVFNLAMEYHNTVRSDSVLVVDAWLNIPEHIVYAYCYAGTVRTTQHRTTASGNSTAPGNKIEHPNLTNNAGVICQNFNTKGCSFPLCKRSHHCSKCGDKSGTHGARSFLK
jgi:hypothetical protein